MCKSLARCYRKRTVALWQRDYGIGAAVKITGVRSRVVEFPLQSPFYPAWGRGQVQLTLPMVIFEVGTDEGLVGYGATGGGLNAAISIDRFVTPHLLGQDPTQIVRLGGVIQDAGILGAPPYCMEIPLWDLLGKSAGLPVYELWGGRADPVRAYCSTGELRPAKERTEQAVDAVAEGFTAIKLRFHEDDPRDDLRVAKAVRSEIGYDVEIMVDANQASADPGHGRHKAWDFQTALRVARELEQLNVVWLEEPLPRYDYRGLSKLRGKLDTLKLAGGEDNHGLHEFKDLLDHECFDVLQPDAMKSMTAQAILNLGAFADLVGVAVVPHTWGQGLALPVHLHVAAALTRCGYVEFPHDPPSGFTALARDQMLTEPLRIDASGHVAVTRRPGFGFMLDEDQISRYVVHTIENGDCQFADVKGALY